MKRTAGSALLRIGVPLATAGTAVALVASPAMASATGHNGPVYITISGGPASWNVSGRWYEDISNDDWFGHIQIIGPNGFSRNGADALDPQLNNVIGSGAGQVCVIGWAKNGDGTYRKVGEPCATVS